jgi:predicted transcriptional regulator of viral defense system
MTMKYEDQLHEYITKHDGIVLTVEVEKAGIPRQYLRILEQKNELERVAHGVYLVPGETKDEMYCIQVRSNRIVFSNQTAREMNGLSDEKGKEFTVTVPRSYATNRLRDTGVHVTTVKDECFNVGLTKMKTPFGRKVQVYDLERTICDTVKNRNKLGDKSFKSIIERYKSLPNKDLKRLKKYAEQMGMTRTIQKYFKFN